MSEFNEIKDGIVRNGSVWSSADFQPTQEDYQTIFELVFKQYDVSGKKAHIGVAHLRSCIRKFKLIRHEGGIKPEFEGTGPFFYGPEAPDHFPEWLLEMMDILELYEIKEGDEWGQSDIAPYLFPYEYMLGHPYEDGVHVRKKPGDFDTDAWTADPKHPKWDEWVEHDGVYRAKDLTQTQMQRAKEEGVVEKVGFDAWRLKI